MLYHAAAVCDVPVSAGPPRRRNGYDGGVVIPRGVIRFAVAAAVAVVVMVSSGSARADAPAPAKDPPAPPPATARTLPPVEMVRDNLLVLAQAKTAVDAARAGHCDVVLQISPQILALDPVFHELLFVNDPPIAACLTGRPLPPAVRFPRPLPREELVADHREPPASVSRILGELLVGAFVGGGGALIGALLGAGLCIGGDDGSDCTPSLIAGAYIGGISTVPLGVYAVGNAGGQTGSLGWTYAGAALGGLGGLLMLANGEDNVTAIGLVLAPQIGAIIAFNSSRRYKPRRVSYGALLRIDDGCPSLGVPLVTRAASHERTVTTIPLLGGTF